jgi:hypothetical protein
MQTNGLGAPLPRPVSSRSPYGLDTGSAGATPGIRPTFPTRTTPAPVERTPQLPAADESSALRPPKGTDPELWKVLTADERAFFAREDAMGPLSYGHRIATTPSLPARGGRLNLRG